MKDYNIDRILKPAFKLFLELNYESVSTTRLEEATGLTRGALYYKHKNKEELFKAVIDRYVLSFLSQYDEVEMMSLKEYMDAFLNVVEKRMREMKELGIQNIHRCYFNLLYQGLKYYPGFDEKFKEVFDLVQTRWRQVVQHAKDSGEIRPDCDVEETARLFKTLYYGMAFEQSFGVGLDVEQLRKSFHTVYEAMNK